MISIIISTYKAASLERISKNIHQTIGDLNYEIIDIQNPRRYSLCQAYNIGVKKAKYPYLCFVHDDVRFLTHDWGKLLISIMQSDDKIGLVGVVGTKFKSSYPHSAWGTGPYIRHFYRGRIYIDDKETEYEFDHYSQKKDIDDVVSVDGLFLFTKQEVFINCQFDEKLLTGFHGYDTDFCLQVYNQSYRTVISRELRLIHYSPGNYDRAYIIANRKIRKKWLSKLPAASRDLDFGFFQLSFYNSIIWLGYLRNMVARKLQLPLKH